MFPLSPYHLPKPYVEVRHSVNEISKNVRSAFNYHPRISSIIYPAADAYFSTHL